MNKSFITNIIAIIIVGIGYFFENNIILTVGLFALSGAVTNWIAVHMLFEKVPFLYGSGVVENRFEEFKSSIHTLIMKQFFTKENLDKFFDQEINSTQKLNLAPVIEKTDFSPAFESLKGAVMESSFGGMLGMFGGEKALEPLQEPFEKKMKVALIEIATTDTFQELIQETLKKSDLTEEISDKIDAVVKARLQELNPKMVKNLVQDMIKEHLGWLVVWGGVFGGVIGFVGSLVL